MTCAITFERDSAPRFIYNDGRRCGTGELGINDLTSPMCIGSLHDGSFRLSDGWNETTMQARCALDDRCVGWWARRNHLRPMATWTEGTRFPVDQWQRTDKRQPCTPPPPPPPPSESLPPPPWPALIISSSLERYARAMVAARTLGFTSVHLAAAYPPTNVSAAWVQVSGKDCARDGYNGVRAAHRNAWRLVAHANVPMAVLEDDIEPIATGVDATWALLNKSAGYDVTFLVRRSRHL